MAFVFQLREHQHNYCWRITNVSQVVSQGVRFCFLEVPPVVLMINRVRESLVNAILDSP